MLNASTRIKEKKIVALSVLNDDKEQKKLLEQAISNDKGLYQYIETYLSVAS